MRSCLPVFLLVMVSRAAAQVPTPLPTPVILSQSQGSGMIGVAVNQTARLNVLNTATPPADDSVTVPACPVTLQIFDDQNNKLAELDVDNLAPSKATHLDYPRPAVATAAAPSRVQVRGLVRLSLSTGTGPVIVASRVTLPLCSLTPTVEVFDSDTGKTQVVLSLAAITPTFILGLPTTQP